MAKFKDFGSFGDKPKEPVTFKLYDEEFHCRPALQGKMLLDLIARTTNSEDPAAGARVISEFFSGVLLADCYARFELLTNDPDKIVDVESLGEIVAWLVEQYTDRPTPRSEVSSSGL